MSAIRFIISRSNQLLSVQGKNHPLPANSLAITTDAAAVITGKSYITPLVVDYFAADLQQRYADLVDLLEPQKSQVFISEPVKIIAAEKEVLDVFTSLVQLSPDSFLQFAYIYCLSLDRRYFSSLLHNCISGNKDFCHFIEENFTQPWSVDQLAQESGLPVRKFKQLFQDNYGKSIKRWLLERRLEHAKKLLASTSMRVIDVAMECGFSHHAHFTDSFRRYFQCSPRQFRQQSGSQFSREIMMFNEVQ